MNPKTEELQRRTQRFAADVIKFVDRLPQKLSAQRVAQQLLDASGSTDSNYRAACRGRSNDEFISKLGIAIEEADESKGWLQLLVTSGLVAAADAAALIQEADELTAIFVSSRKTAERRREERERLNKQIATASRRR